MVFCPFRFHIRVISPFERLITLPETGQLRQTRPRNECAGRNKYRPIKTNLHPEGMPEGVNGVWPEGGGEGPGARRAPGRPFSAAAGQCRSRPSDPSPPPPDPADPGADPSCCCRAGGVPEHAGQLPVRVPARLLAPAPAGRLRAAPAHAAPLPRPRADALTHPKNTGPDRLARQVRVQPLDRPFVPLSSPGGPIS